MPEITGISEFVSLLGEEAPFVAPPPTLPVTADLAAHWIGDDVAGADGDRVSTWPDASGNGVDLTQTGTDRPFIRRGVRLGHDAVDFTGRLAGKEFMTRASVPVGVSSSTNGTLFIAGEMKFDAAVQETFSIGDSVSGIHHLEMGVRPTRRLTISSTFGGGPQGGTMQGDTSVGADGFHILMMASDGVSYALRLDAAPESFTVISGSDDGAWWGDLAVTPNLITVGARSGSAPVSFYNGRILEIILYDAEKDLTEIGQINSYLQTKYAL